MRRIPRCSTEAASAGIPTIRRSRRSADRSLGQSSMGVGDRLSLRGGLAGVTRRFAIPTEPANDHAERHTMAVTTWVVVGDGSRARIFETPGLKLDLREIEDLVNVVPS